MRLVNKGMTNKIITLHERGFTMDFVHCNGGRSICTQADPLSIFQDFLVLESGSYYDKLTFSEKFLYAIETSHGKKGILITDSRIIFKK